MVDDIKILMTAQILYTLFPFGRKGRRWDELYAWERGKYLQKAETLLFMQGKENNQ